MSFWEPSAEVAKAGADLARVPHPSYRCPCGFSTASGDEHEKHRIGFNNGPLFFRDPSVEAPRVLGCQATWSKA